MLIMVVANQSDTMYAGNPRVFRFTITDEDVVGSPAKDISGRVIKWALCASENGAPLEPALVQKTTVGSGGITITGGPAGECEVALAAADTVDLLGEHYWELEVFDVSGLNPVVCATGIETILPNVVNA